MSNQETAHIAAPLQRGGCFTYLCSAVSCTRVVDTNYCVCQFMQATLHPHHSLRETRRHRHPPALLQATLLHTPHRCHPGNFQENAQGCTEMDNARTSCMFDLMCKVVIQSRPKVIICHAQCHPEMFMIQKNHACTHACDLNRLVN